MGTVALDESDRFIYDPTDALLFDPDGILVTMQTQPASLTGAPEITRFDIAVI